MAYLTKNRGCGTQVTPNCMYETTTTQTSRNHSTAVLTLAVIGFIALVGVGIILAIYAARYVPVAISELGNPWGHGGASLSVVPDTIPFPDTPVATSTGAVVATSTPATTTPAVVTTPTYTHTASTFVGYRAITTPYPTPGSTQIPVPTTYTGLANLTVAITAVGYTDDDGHFVQDTSITNDNDLVVKILVTNNGTNKTGEWRIHTVIPASTDSTFEHEETEPSLEPKGILPLTLTLSRGHPRIGNDEEIHVEVDSDNDVTESNENDNEAETTIDVRS